MTEVRFAKDSFWHLALNEQGVYMRLTPTAAPVTIKREDAEAIYEALGDLLAG